MLEDKIIDDGGRYIILKFIIQDFPFQLINLYNSNNENEHVQIIEKVRLAIENIDPNHSYNVVMGTLTLYEILFMIQMVVL